MKKPTIIFLVFLFFIIGYYSSEFVRDTEEVMSNEITGSFIGEIEKIPFENVASPDVYFCPQDECMEKMISFLNEAQESVYCALFDIDLPELITFFDEASTIMDIRVVVDDTNYENVEDVEWVRKDTTGQLSHNKFCVVDNKAIWTGSFNPTERGNYHNNNNAVLFRSKLLAKNYAQEFEELWNGQYGKGEKVAEPIVNLSGIVVENYFCPEDWCANKVVYILQDAKKSIHFMTFSFTHDMIGDLIIEKWNSGVEVSGVFERTQNNKYNEFSKVEELGMDVHWDGNKANMHHKVFIVDGETVVTGSFNPSKNGDENNDENLLIIHDVRVAEMFEEEFSRVYGDAVKS